MRVTLRCLEAGMYEIQLDGQHLDGPVLLLAENIGWRYAVKGTWDVRSHRSFGAARAWLATPDGRAWLDQLPRAEAGAR